MVDKNTLVKVTNRSNGSVGYKIPDLRLKRHYEAGETKEVTVEEMEKLSQERGGRKLLRDYLLIHNKEVVNMLLNDVEPEYFYTEEDVKNLLLNGSVDQLEDCLNFGGEAVIGLVQKYAVELKIADLNKRKLILNKTGFNVTSAIEINEETDESTPVIKDTGRKAQPINAAVATESTDAPTRKVTIIEK